MIQSKRQAHKTNKPTKLTPPFRARRVVMPPSPQIDEQGLARALGKQYDSPTEIVSNSTFSEESDDGGNGVELGLAHAPSSNPTPTDKAAVTAAAEAPQEEEESMCRRRRRQIGAILCGIFTAGILFIILYFVVILDGDVNNLQAILPPEWAEIFDEDPFDAVGPEDAKRWRNIGRGVNLPVINALDAGWQSFFDKSIYDWDNGYPDALDLTVTNRDPDFDCMPETGRVKVCNGNYGETSWKGRAEILSDSLTDTIVAASARMNEYYLSTRNRDEMQYAMCHELGHTWGLHHTDESFTNRDLGNCMDYTNRHGNNLTPDYSNYAFLHALYGLVPGAAPYDPPTAAPVPATPAPAPTLVSNGSSFPAGGTNNGSGGSPASNQQNNQDKEAREEKKDKKEKDKNKDRDLPEQQQEGMLEDDSELPEWLLSAIKAARMDEKLAGLTEIELPGGYMLHIHQLRT